MKQYLFLILLTFSLNSIAEQEENNRQIKAQEPESGTVVFPKQPSKGKERQCLTICQEWGEECTFIATTGSRQCRRVCKSLGQECF